MKIGKNKTAVYIARIINKNPDKTDFYLQDNHDLQISDIIKIIDLNISSGTNLHFSYCDVLCKVMTVFSCSKESGVCINELKNLIQKVQKFSQNNNKIYWYGEGEEQDTSTGIDLIYKLVKYFEIDNFDFSYELDDFPNFIFNEDIYNILDSIGKVDLLGEDA